MKHLLRSVAAFGLLLLSGTAAHSTVSEYAEFFVPYERAQSGEICLSRQIMEAEFGIPLASMMAGVFSETKTLHQHLGGENKWKDINLLTRGAAAIFWSLNFDRYTNSGIYDYSFTLDMGPLAAANGSSAEGRKKTLNAAKLAVIAMVKTAELTHGAGQFRLWLRFDNLPSQNGLTGAIVHAGKTDWPGWPYTSSSSVYRAFLTEMIGPRCR